MVGYDYLGPPEWVILKLVLSGQDAEFVEAQRAPNVQEAMLRAFIRESIRTR